MLLRGHKDKIRLSKMGLMVDLDKHTLCWMVRLEDLMGGVEEEMWRKYMPWIQQPLTNLWGGLLWKAAEKWAVDKNIWDQWKISFLKKEILSSILWPMGGSPKPSSRFLTPLREAMVTMMHVDLFKCSLGIRERIGRVTSASEVMWSFIYTYVPFLLSAMLS